MAFNQTNPLADKKIAIVGDVMVDRYVYGSVERISPEAPIPVVSVNRRTTHLGGAGNVAANLVALGATPLLCGRVGRDELATAFREISGKSGIATDYLVEDAVPTTSKTRVIARNQQVVRFDEELCSALGNPAREILLKNLKVLRREAEVVIVSDYAKGLIDQALYNEILAIWQGGVVLADPKPRKTMDYTGATALTPNLAEATALAGEDMVANENAPVAALAEELIEKFNLSRLLITRSEKGMSLFGGAAPLHLSAQLHEVADVSGAGDTVIATFAAALAAGEGWEEASKLANIAGGMVVAKLGTATASWAEIASHLGEEKTVNQAAA